MFVVDAGLIVCMRRDGDAVDAFKAVWSDSSIRRLASAFLAGALDRRRGLL
jgi:hypothetical protein